MNLAENKIYVLAGTPGVGKSTILREFKKIKPQFQVINFGDVMFDIAKENFKLKEGGEITNRDEIRQLSSPNFKKLQNRVVRHLAKIQSSFILNTHASVKTVDGYHPGLPRYVLEQLPIDCFIYIHAPLEQIIERRNNDNSRKRDVETIEDLMEHDEMNRNYLASYSMFCNSPVKFLVNAEGSLDKCVNELCKLLE